MPLINGFLMAMSYRLRGGWTDWMPRNLARILFFLPFAFAICYQVFIGRDVNEFLAFGLDPSLLQYGVALVLCAICWFAIVMGHGSYMDLNNRPDLADDEILCFFLDFIFGKGKPSYTRDYWGLCITGLLVTLPVGIACMIAGQYISGFIIGISGFTKGFAYQIGYAATNNDRLPFKINGPTEIGELLFGFFAGVATANVVNYGLLILLYAIIA